MILSIPLILGGIALILWSRRPEALAPPAPIEGEDASTAHPPEVAADPFPAYESEVAEPFAPARPDEPARPA